MIVELKKSPYDYQEGPSGTYNLFLSTPNSWPKVTNILCFSVLFRKSVNTTRFVYTTCLHSFRKLPDVVTTPYDLYNMRRSMRLGWPQIV
jgi:hypothetical protein